MMDKRGYTVDLGLVDYEKAWTLQRLLWSKRVENQVPDTLLLLEHAHVITLGRRGNRSHLLVSPEAIEAMGIPIFHTERGGEVTYHGPGQLVAYPIMDLKSYGYRLLRYIEQLEEVILRVLEDFGIPGRRDASNRGVWVAEEKIASVGVAVKRWVSFHGIALNYNTDLRYFELMNPCGLEDIRMTSMSKLLRAEIWREELIQHFVLRFQEVFPRAWEAKEAKEILPSENVIVEETRP